MEAERYEIIIMPLDFNSKGVIFKIMNTTKQSFTLNEIAGLTGFPRRTIRYYIQIGLVDRPGGAGRGAHYSRCHLGQLLEIRKWQQAGLGLERIRELFQDEDAGDALVKPPPIKKGSIDVRSHVTIGEGVELILTPARSGLTPEEIRRLADGVIELYETLLNPKE